MTAEVLYLVHRLPYPPDKGDRIRAYHLIRFLSERARVHVACLADEPFDDRALAPLRSACAELSIVSMGPWRRRLGALGSLLAGRTASEGAFDAHGLRTIVRQWVARTRFQSVLLSSSSMVPYLTEVGAVPAVVDLVDVDSEKWLEYAKADRGPRRWLHGTEGGRLRRLEAELPERVRAVTVVSAAEAVLLKSFCRRPENVHVVANGVDLEYFRPQEKVGGTEPSCLFVGALDYRPNVEGAVWFCREVWPSIRARTPTAVFRLVGRKPAPEVLRFARMSGVEVVGSVPDVRPYLAQATVVVVPLHLARGTQNKVLEALAAGKAVIASPQSLNGISPHAGTHLLSASSPAEWTAQVVELFGDASKRNCLGDEGRRFVEEHHDWNRTLKPLEPLVLGP